MVIVAEKRGVTDGPAHRLLDLIKSPIPIVLMAKTSGFQFNESLLRLDKYVLVEFSELGWNWNLTETHRWGVNTNKFHQFEGEEYDKFDTWVANNPPVLTFTRELLKSDVTSNHVPIDYPCWYSGADIQTKVQFDCRPLSSFFFWGRSHEARLKLHSNIWKAASDIGFSVCDNLSFFDRFVSEENGEKWASFWMPHYGRIELLEILAKQQLSKTSIAMPGAGVKTFRHCEASLNSIMVKWKDDLAWAFQWDETNCILTSEGNEIEDVRKALQNPNLYQIYLKGMKNCQNYQIDNYVKHIESIINDHV